MREQRLHLVGYQRFHLIVCFWALGLVELTLLPPGERRRIDLGLPLSDPSACGLPCPVLTCFLGGLSDSFQSDSDSAQPGSKVCVSYLAEPRVNSMPFINLASRSACFFCRYSLSCCSIIAIGSPSINSSSLKGNVLRHSPLNLVVSTAGRLDRVSSMSRCLTSCE